ncbi:MAG TPA: phosphate ABC transporter substrate-binding protein PstS, partial [Terriglobales bacterium]
SLWILAPACALSLLVGCSSSAKPPASQERAAESVADSIPAGSTVIRGAGATFPFVLYKRWFTVYHEANSGTYVKYAAVGSGEGIRRFLGKDLAEGEAVDFGASDAAMSDAEINDAGNNVLMVPATAGCVVLAYSIPGFTGELKLSRRAYAGIFLGEITNWNDQRIAETNPGMKLPDLTIVTVVRQDSSGTTYAFTRNLDAINERWRAQFGPSTLVNWPGEAMRAKGNEGVAGLIEKSAGSIGYVGYEFARRIGLDYATLENKDGKFVKPSEQSCSEALGTVELPANLRAFVPDPAGADSYPISTFSWILLRKRYPNAQTADAVRRLFLWALQDGQKYAPELGYVPLPDPVLEKSLTAVKTVSPGS